MEMSAATEDSAQLAVNGSNAWPAPAAPARYSGGRRDLLYFDAAASTTISTFNGVLDTVVVAFGL